MELWSVLAAILTFFFMAPSEHPSSIKGALDLAVSEVCNDSPQLVFGSLLSNKGTDKNQVFKTYITLIVIPSINLHNCFWKPPKLVVMTTS